MWRLVLITFCSFSLSVGQGPGDEQNDSLMCIKRNEEPACVKVCPPEKTCRTRDIRFNCFNDDSKCVDKCVCKPGYHRNVAKLPGLGKDVPGDCITDEQCDKCPGKHEYFACGSACDNVCANLHIQNKTNCPIINIKCNEKCYCEDGFARDDKNECIPIESCPKTPPHRHHREIDSLMCIKRNEEPACVKVCPPEKTCRTRDIRFNCFNDDSKCVDKCVCKPGYHRNVAKLPGLGKDVPGDCITDEQCDKCPGKHEYFACGSACDNVCANLHIQNKTNCPIINIKCNEKCYCEDGFARDDKNECIPIESCPKTPPHRHHREIEPTCGENEEWTTCKKSCPPETCLSIVARFKCDSNEPCKGRCACKAGFLRRKHGAPCMPTCQCPEIMNSPECKCKTNEFFGCVKACPPDTCHSLVAKYRCIDEPCQFRCRCKPGYLRLKKGTECIPYQECPQITV